MDKDAEYAKAFTEVVALDHAGYGVKTRGACGGPDCGNDVDVCIGFGAEGAGWQDQIGRCGEDVDVCIGFGAEAADPRDQAGRCGKAMVPKGGRYAGVGAILREARAFVLDRIMAAGRQGSMGGWDSHGGRDSIGGWDIPGGAEWAGAAAFGAGALVCVYGRAGGLGTSSAAIGIGREFARYRGEKALYLSMEDSEDAGLFPDGLSAMRSEEALYRYIRVLKDGATPEAFAQVFSAAAARDEYGLYRIAPDDGLNRLAGLEPSGLYGFLRHIGAALGLSRIVLDFGTRLHLLSAFAANLAPEEACFVEALAAGADGTGDAGEAVAGAGVVETGAGRELFGDGGLSFSRAFPYCEEDIRQVDGRVDVGLANAFGLAVKEVCDKIMGDRP